MARVIWFVFSNWFERSLPQTLAIAGWMSLSFKSGPLGALIAAFCRIELVGFSPSLVNFVI